LSDRSVAADASGRRGKVASEIIDALDVCLGCGVKVLPPAKTGRFTFAVQSLSQWILEGESRHTSNFGFNDPITET
jgi:hypothetical protein